MKEKKIPMRQCVGCREERSKYDLIRIVRTPEGEMIIDRTGKQNGRGAYICKCAECFEKAVRNKGIERALKQTLGPDELKKLSDLINGG